MFGLQRWKPGTLLATWVAYWAALIGVTIGPGLLRAWRIARAPGVRGTLTASFDNGRLLLEVHNAGSAGDGWIFNTSMWTALAWIAAPPLVLWLLWLASRPRRGARPRDIDPMLAAPQREFPMHPTMSARPAADNVERPL